jgi:hypothetical protein
MWMFCLFVSSKKSSHFHQVYKVARIHDGEALVLFFQQKVYYSTRMYNRLSVDFLWNPIYSSYLVCLVNSPKQLQLELFGTMLLDQE